MTSVTVSDLCKQASHHPLKVSTHTNRNCTPGFGHMDEVNLPVFTSVSASSLHLECGGGLSVSQTIDFLFNKSCITQEIVSLSLFSRNNLSAM